jgi:hypothetical protein
MLEQVFLILNIELIPKPILQVIFDSFIRSIIVENEECTSKLTLVFIDEQIPKFKTSFYFLIVLKRGTSSIWIF